MIEIPNFTNKILLQESQFEEEEEEMMQPKIIVCDREEMQKYREKTQKSEEEDLNENYHRVATHVIH
jgi:hypothetical protein